MPRSYANKWWSQGILPHSLAPKPGTLSVTTPGFTYRSYTNSINANRISKTIEKLCYTPSAMECQSDSLFTKR